MSMYRRVPGLEPAGTAVWPQRASEPIRRREMLRTERVPVYHARGRDSSTGTLGIFTPALTQSSLVRPFSNLLTVRTLWFPEATVKTKLTSIVDA